MAKKLTNDEVNLMVHINASDAQQNLTAMQMEAGRLSAALKQTTQAIKDNDKEARALEKQMAKLAEKGKINTERYKQLEAQYQRNFQRSAQLTKQASDQQKALDDNARAQKALTDNMKLSEMTMVQLQKRHQELAKAQKNAVPNSDEWKNLTKQLQEVDSQMQENTIRSQTMMEALSSIPSPMSKIGQVVQSIKKGFDVLKAHPFLMIGAVVGGIIKMIKMGIEGSDELSTKFAGVMGYINEGLKQFTNIVARAGEAVARFFTGDFSGAKDALKNIGSITAGMQAAGKAAYDAAILQDKYNDIINRNNDLTKINNAEIAQLRLTVRDETKTLEQREAAMRKINSLMLQNYRAGRDEILYNYEVWTTKNAALMAEFNRVAPEQMKLLEANMKTLADGGELNFKQMRAMANAVNEVAATTDHATEQEKADFRKFFSDLSTMQQQYFSDQRTMNRENSNLKKDILEQEKAQQQQAEQAGRDNRENLYQQETAALQKEAERRVLALTQQYAAQKLSKDEYDEYVRNSEEYTYTQMLQLARKYSKDTTGIEQKLAQIQIARNERMKKDADELNQKLEEQKNTLEQIAEVTGAAANAMQDGLGKNLMQTIGTVTTGISKITDALNDAEKSGIEKGAAIANEVGKSVTQGLQMTSQMLNTIFQMEADALTEAKNKELAAVGDNEEEKQRITQEYAEKELELKKKQANADAAISSANLWVSTATGIINAWSAAMKYGPVAGPIIGATLTAMMLAMAGVQQAAIVKQRNAITSQTLDSTTTGTGQTQNSGSSASSATTASLKEEYQNGPQQFADGGYTGDGSRYEAAGIVHRGEYVVAQPELHRPQVARMVSQIEGLRQTRLNGRLRNGRFSNQGFADGGYTDGNLITNGTAQSLKRAIIEAMQAGEIHAVVNYQDLQHAADRVRRARG